MLSLMQSDVESGDGVTNAGEGGGNILIKVRSQHSIPR